MRFDKENELMMEEYTHVSEDTALKENAINLIKHHKKYCEGVECNISLGLIRKLLERAGIKLTEEEKSLFV